MMQSKDSADFLTSIAKRARKYYLGVTTITQDVEDFLKDDLGKAIVTNSSIQILMKQHPAAIDKIGEVFYLSEGEKQFLLACDVGEGLFFAGNNHVAMRVVSSNQEHQLVTTKPEEILAQKKQSVTPTSSPTSPQTISLSKNLPQDSTGTPKKSETLPPQSPLPPRIKSEIIMENGQPVNQ